MAPTNFSCDSCSQIISPTNSRVHCLVCDHYDLCANCALGEKTSDGHLVSHKAQIFKTSGAGNGQQPPVLSQTISLSYNRAAAAPLPPLPQRRSIPPPIPSRHATSPSTSSPESPPASQSQWTPFFNEDMSPTQAFITLMHNIFAYLDPTSTGYLIPEAYSRFLDDQGYLTHEDSWKSNLTPIPGQFKEDLADKSLKNAYDLFSIDYILQQRPRAPGTINNSPFGSQLQSVLGAAFTPALANALTPASVSGGMMPLISRQGFIDITSVEVLCDPSRHWGMFSCIVRKYDLPMYRGWGDMPRGVLPEYPDQRMLQRVKQVSAVAQEQGKIQLDAAHAKAMMEAKGREAAIDLISPPHRYTYY